MEGERLQENRPQGFLKGLLLGALILAALGLGVSLFGPGGAGGGRGSSPAAGPAMTGGGALPGEEPAGGEAGGAASGRGAPRPGVATPGELPGRLPLTPGGPAAGPAGIPAEGAGLQGSTTAESSSGGVILDAVNGNPLAGASVRLTWFHGTADLSLAGLSPLGAVLHRSSGDGSFNLPLVEPEDPRLLVHVQVSHPGYAPRVCVLHGRQDSSGKWTAVEVSPDSPDPVLLGARLEIYLRRAPLVPLRLLGPDGRGLSHAPLAVRPWRGDHSFLQEPEIEWTWSGRLVRPGPWRVLYTDEDGVLSLPFSETPWDVDLLHPLYFLWGRRQQGFSE
ncbi:MAG: carboxypeptidase-like regulatory domain-containing protein, partial [Planctomycetota bacterium]|nr:carboxypeptidase-like regulatory domain-containing protein [Planctomycetota bacterium]